MTIERVPVVSVVIPTHNRVEMLPEAVHSVLAETALPVEAVVVDDNSSDETASWLARQSDSRMRWSTISPGRGGSAARNTGLAECRAEFVLFLDDDDKLRPGALGRLLDALRRHPGAARSMGGYATFGVGVLKQRSIRPPLRLSRRIWIEELFRWNLPPGTTLWRTELVRQLGGWDEGLRRAEDLDLNLRAWRGPAAVISSIVLDYRYHPTQYPLSYWWDIDLEVRSRFVDSLSEPERERAQRILESRKLFQAGLEAYAEQNFRAGLAGFVASLRIAPELVRSPLMGPWLLAMVAKAAAASAMPSALASLVARARHQRKGTMPDERRAP